MTIAFIKYFSIALWFMKLNNWLPVCEFGYLTCNLFRYINNVFTITHIITTTITLRRLISRWCNGRSRGAIKYVVRIAPMYDNIFFALPIFFVIHAIICDKLWNLDVRNLDFGLPLFWLVNYVWSLKGIKWRHLAFFKTIDLDVTREK